MGSSPTSSRSNVGVEAGQLLALGVMVIAMAYLANTALMGAGFMLTGYQLTGYFSMA